MIDEAAEIDLDAVTRLLAELVSINSVNPDLVPAGPGEQEIASFVGDWLTRAGLEVEFDEAAPGRTSVLAVARGGGGGRSLMLNAHLDTVGVEGMENPFSPRTESGRMYGRGAYDMKAGLAAIMLASSHLARRGLAGDVILSAVSDEEYASVGCQSILRRWFADACIVTEPTSLRVCIAQRASPGHVSRFRVEPHTVRAPISVSMRSSERPRCSRRSAS